MFLRFAGPLVVPLLERLEATFQGFFSELEIFKAVVNSQKTE